MFTIDNQASLLTTSVIQLMVHSKTSKCLRWIYLNIFGQQVLLN